MNKTRRSKLNLHKKKMLKNKRRRLLKKKKLLVKKQLKYRTKKFGNPMNNLISQIKEQKSPTFNKGAYKPPIEPNEPTIKQKKKEEFNLSQWKPPKE